MSLEISLVSSLSLASPPAPIRYFDLLPPELVQLVVERTVDREVHYSERQATLRSLCLTSRLLKSIASPILLSDIRILVNGDKLQQLVNNNDPAVFIVIKKLNLSSMDLRVVSLEREEFCALKILSDNVPRLEELSYTLGDFELELFSSSNLVTLTVKDMHFLDCTLMFPQVKFLSIDNCHFEIGQHRFILPSLRHLVYNPYNIGTRLSATELTLLNGLSASPLCSITVPCWLDTSSLAGKLGAPVAICYMVHLHTSLLNITASVETLCISHRWRDSYLRDWIRFIETAKELKTVIIPPSTNVGKRSTTVEEEGELLKLCQRRQIRVVREVANEGWTFWDLVSPWFIKESEKLRDDRLRGMEGRD